MKKLIIMMLLVSGFLFNQSAHAQKTRYYYYPDQDVYYDPGARNYVWNDNGHWTTVNRLPDNIKIDRRARRVTVWHNNPQVWEDNDMHRKKYRRHDRDEDRRDRRDEGDKHRDHDRDRD